MESPRVNDREETKGHIVVPCIFCGKPTTNWYKGKPLCFKCTESIARTKASLPIK